MRESVQNILPQLSVFPNKFMTAYLPEGVVLLFSSQHLPISILKQGTSVARAAMFSNFFTRSFGQLPFVRYEQVAPEQDHWVQTTDRLCTAHVLIVGKGICSHWASLWIFDTGEVWCVELSAIDQETGERWGENQCIVELLKMPSAAEKTEDGFVQLQQSEPSMGRMEKVQRAIDSIWPHMRAGLNRIVSCIDCMLSAQHSKEEIQAAMDSIWCMMSTDDVQHMAEILLLIFVESGLAAWPSQHRELVKVEIEQIESALKYIWPIPSNSELERAKARLLQGIIDVESTEECKKEFQQTMDAFWPMQTLFDGHAREMGRNTFSPAY